MTSETQGASEDLATRAKFALLDCVGALPSGLLEGLVRVSLRGRRLAVCLHRVTESRRPADPVPAITVCPETLDSLIGRLVRSTAADSSPALTVSFDDGYADAAAYVRSRAPVYEHVEWIYFVCPKRIEKRIAFPWDEYEERAQEADHALPEWDELAASGAALPQQIAESCADGVADMREHRLATVDECRELSRLPNVCLGNHTNAHVPFTNLSPGEVKAEVQASIADFERLFGPCAHLAFPHGTPGIHFTTEHVAAVRDVWDGVLWSTDPLPYHPNEREAGRVLPRLAVDGTWPCSRVLAWCLRRCWTPRTSH